MYLEKLNAGREAGLGRDVEEGYTALMRVSGTCTASEYTRYHL